MDIGTQSLDLALWFMANYEPSAFVTMKDGSLIAIDDSWVLNSTEERCAAAYLCGTKAGGVDRFPGKSVEAVDVGSAGMGEDTGFASIKTFYRVFQKRNGIPPGAFRARENR